MPTIYSSHQYFNEIPLAEVKLGGGFWGGRCALNRDHAIFYQWDQLEQTGRVDNFRIVGGTKPGFRRGFFYNDSDVHKWAEAAAAILAAGPHRRLEKILEEYITVIRRAQMDDGYIFTYNQFHFPGDRWKNLQIEHELYTHGHLIEAGITLMEATGRNDLLDISRKAADLVVRDFAGAGPTMTPGHEEIEIALIRLYRATGEGAYLETARHFLEQRGRIRFFALRLAGQFFSQSRRSGAIAKMEKESTGAASASAGFDFTENLTVTEPPFLKLRANISFLSGKFFQQHRPIRKQRSPEGHAVRWGYLATAMTMLYRETGDRSIYDTLTEAWDRMVRRRMYVTGGIGSLPVIEGFGRDYELDNRYAYCETCAALASIFWSREMLLATGEARYADLIEWQMYNAAAAGIALDGRSYLYRNPLESDGQTRRPWYATACCPSNISRAWASLGKYIHSTSGNDVWIHQYIGSTAEIGSGGMNITINSGLPWNGHASIQLHVDNPIEFSLNLRVPSWSGNPSISINGDTAEFDIPAQPNIDTASGYSPYRSWFLRLRRRWDRETKIEIDLPMDIVFHRSHDRVKNNRGKVALSRGPLVYCLESIDNPMANIPKAVLDTGREVTARHSASHFDGAWLLQGADPAGTTLTFIPYFCWANRGQSAMQVWVKEK
ncbi:MAG TPA: glycoside hydrolase family 127 protein [Spirochaetota bacterium]|nr:glycoside hydrolase family 127 protein [Spirochaetota bacterium]HPL18319.1 glycoside hydrolase family 127 protein [Spirochaetota bacterium]HRS76072.1 glycoside hydrolase family 127 protein [Spirochaetota bacterium]HRT73736.1 glycoside hydrolase family 127 protein [Spirochaetota bacterium]